MKQVRIAQIGCGHDHSVLFQTLSRRSDLFEIAGYSISEEEKVKYPDRLAYFEGQREMTTEEILSDPSIDAVAIETCERDLTKTALLAAQAGKAIHMDKPGGFSLSEFETLVETVKRKKLLLRLGYMYRDNPMVTELREQVRSGDLGRILSIDAEMNCWHKPERRQWMETMPGGMMFFLGCHLVDLVLQFQGKPERVLPLNRCTGADGVTALDFGMAVLEYPDGISTVKACDAERGGYLRRRLVVTGTKKTVELRPLEWQLNNRLLTSRAEWTGTRWHELPTLTNSAPFFRYDPMMEAFARQVRGEEENPFTPDYELLVYQTLRRCCGMEDDAT